MSFREIVAVLVGVLSMLGMAISMAVLIFSGPLASALPRAIAAFTIGAAITAIWTGMRSSIVPAATIIQDGPAIVLVAVAAGFASAGDARSVSNVFVLLGLSSVLTGVTMWLMGHWHLGAMARYVPTTVVRAFMAGTGWLLAKGGLEVMVGFGLGLDTIGELFATDLLKLWIPGVVVGAAAWLVGRSDRLPPTAISLVIVGSMVGFYAVVFGWSSIKAVESGGWLIGPFPSGAGPTLISPTEVAGAAWRDYLVAAPSIASVVGVSVLPLLLNVTGLAMRNGDAVDLDGELRTAGLANIVVGPLGCAPSFIAVSSTVLLEKVGARRRLVPVIAGLLMVVFGVIGVELVGYVPRLVVGALLVMVGVALLADWVVVVVKSVDRIEQVLSVGILAVIASVGILQGIAAGVAAICAVFIVRSSRADPVRVVSNGLRRQSRVDRPADDIEILRGCADQLAVFELQGYLFFGSLTSLEDRVRSAVEVASTRSGSDLDAVVLDFHTVTGIDTSGYSLIGEVVRSLGPDVVVVISSLADDVRSSLAIAESDGLAGARWANTLDEALELTERAQLLRHRVIDPSSAVSPNDRSSIAERLGVSELLFDQFERTAVRAGAVVMEQGSPSDGMFLVIDGVLTAFQVDESGQRHRLRQFGRGASIGEIGIVTGSPRSAEIVAQTDASALWLSIEGYQRLRQDQPQLALELQDFIMKEQARRVVTLSQGLAQSAG